MLKPTSTSKFSGEEFFSDWKTHMSLNGQTDMKIEVFAMYVYANKGHSYDKKMGEGLKVSAK